MSKRKCHNPCRDPEIRDNYTCCLDCEKSETCDSVCKNTECEKRGE